MRRKLFFVTVALALLTTGYAFYACLVTRGLRVYLMGTQLGAILVGTWQIVLLAAILFWIPTVIVLARKVVSLHRYGARSTAHPSTEVLDESRTPQETASLSEDSDGCGATEVLTENDQGITQVLPREEHTAGERSVVPGGMPTVVLGTGPTEPLGANLSVILGEPENAAETTLPLEAPESREGTEILDDTAYCTEDVTPTEVLSAQETQLLPPVKGTTDAPGQAETGVQYCPNCGHLVTGKKFCAKCGTKVG